MNFSIIIPTLENYRYLENCINSITKNSTFDHEIIVHLNGHCNSSENFLKEKKISYTKSLKNIGLCSAVNIAAKKSKHELILYSHDDMYFLPGWDTELVNEIIVIGHNNFYLSSAHISAHISNKGRIEHIVFDAGNSIDSFDEDKLLNNYEKFEFDDLQGSHWAPHLIHKSLWNKIGGFSEEFNPGFASDPDLNMKLWIEGVRIFKNVSKSRVYHFGSVTTRKGDKINRNPGKKKFLNKWGITVEMFTKCYLNRGEKYNGPLSEPKKIFNIIKNI
tara:strand:+ start:352 stop:1176 length:825 start_codon:yes stop_codon:yes gene_type:complete